MSAVRPHRSSAEQIAQNVLEKNRQRIIDGAVQLKNKDYDKNLEIENLKRLLASISQRLDALKTI